VSDDVANDAETSAAVQTPTTASSKETIDAEIALEQQGCVLIVLSPHGIAMLKGLYFTAVVFRSTLRQSRSNKSSLKCPSVNPSVCPRIVSSISMKFGMQVEFDE